MSDHALRIRQILDVTNAAQMRLLSAVGSMSDSAASLTGPGGGWNAAEIAMHVAITNEWIAGVLTGDIQAAQPAPAGFKENWGAIVIPDRMHTFPALIPPGGVTRQQAVNRLDIADTQVNSAIQSLDEQRAKLCVMLPFGTMSLYQLAEFVAMHTNRHMAQLKRLEAPLEVTT